MNQLRALLWLRWLEFKYGFRRREGVWNLAAVILLFVLLAPAAVGVGIGAGFLAYHWRLSSESQQILLLWVHLLLAASFFGYHLTNLFDPQRFEAFDLNRFRQFPISIFRLYRLNLLASVNDTVFMFFIPAQIGLVVGLFVADGWQALLAIPVLLVYNGLNLAWSYWVGSLIGGFVQARWRKEMMVLFLPGLALVVYLVPYWWFHSHQGSAERYQAFSAVIEYLVWCPSGWVGQCTGWNRAGVLLAVSFWFVGYLRVCRVSIWTSAD